MTPASALEDARLTWRMPADLVSLAGLVALVVAWPRIAPPTSATWLVVDVLRMGMGTSAAGVAAWADSWGIEQRW